MRLIHPTIITCLADFQSKQPPASVMQNRLTLAALICMSAFVHQAEAAAPAANDVRQEFTALCEAWDAVESALKLPLQHEPATTAFAEIAALNLSVATKEWQEQIKKVKEAGGWRAFKEAGKPKWDTVEWDTLMPIWIAAYDEVHAPGNKWAAAHPRPANAASTEAIQHAIKFAANQAYAKMQAVANAAKGQTATDLQDSFTTKLTEALCGTADYASKRPGTGCTDITGTPAKNTVCTKANNGQALKLDLLCICANDAAEVCKGGFKTTLISTDNLKAASLAAATAGCPQKKHETITIEQLEGAISAVRPLIGRDKDAAAAVGVLGKLNNNANDCSHSSNGACVNYAAYYTNPNRGFNSIPWVKAATEAVATYKLFQERKQAAERIASEIEDLKAAVQAEYIKPMTALLATHQRMPPTNAAAVIDTQCPTRNQTAEDCPEAKCDYDKTKKECKPKAGTQATPAGTGDAPPATDDKANTTGNNNSFVINKTPLWLAVLLF
uniref:Variant surface glycoprotein 1125.8 n=1 Tax=Trypanosoma brucei TaxID=5691 RepID=A0A1J0R410_9TRYP|nr:variant surface glycoprotein 1125.8 [Trypanosoma brucei]